MCESFANVFAACHRLLIFSRMHKLTANIPTLWKCQGHSPICFPATERQNSANIIITIVTVKAMDLFLFPCFFAYKKHGLLQHKFKKILIVCQEVLSKSWGQGAAFFYYKCPQCFQKKIWNTCGAIYKKNLSWSLVPNFVRHLLSLWKTSIKKIIIRVSLLNSSGFSHCPYSSFSIFDYPN